MTRFLAILVILAGTYQIAVASGLPEKVEEMIPEPTGSAAVAGRFVERPPTEAGYPVGILVKMREKLSAKPGEKPVPEPSEGNGH